MPIPRDVEVLLEVISSEKGGTPHALVTGARPQFFYQGHDWDCDVTVIGASAIDPGSGGKAYLAFISPLRHLAHLRIGTPFALRYGHRVFAFGVVTALIDLASSAEREQNTPSYSWRRDVAT